MCVPTLRSSPYSEVTACATWIMEHSSTTPPMPSTTFGEQRSNSRGGGAIVPPSRQNTELGCYQHIRMEYCSGGDLEAV